MARNGKIARLSRPIRNELNTRLDNGEPGSTILEWLNELEEVQVVLDAFFDGQPINDPNLTAWRQGGFLEWKQHQDSCDWARRLTDEARQITEESGLMPITDKVSSLAGLILGKIMRNLDSNSLAEAGGREEFQTLVKTLVHLRREDREGARLRMELERYAEQRTREELANLKAAHYCLNADLPVSPPIALLTPS